MRRLVWDASFRRAFKRTTRRQPLLQEHILDILAILAENPNLITPEMLGLDHAEFARIAVSLIAVTTHAPTKIHLTFR